MYILGVSFDYHDAAAALLDNGEIVGAAHEERFTRKKGDSSLPRNAIKFCLDTAGIAASDIDCVVHYENPLLKFERILKTALRQLPRSRELLREVLVDWFVHGKFDTRQRIASALGISEARVVNCRHHQAHAASAFFCSPFDEAAIVTLDGVGEFETATISLGRGNTITQLAKVEFPHSLGLVYSAFTAYEGFEVNEGEYKVMGMSGFGTPDRFESIMGLFELSPDGTFRVRQHEFDFVTQDKLPFNQSLIDLLGPPRVPEAPFDPRASEANGGKTEDQRYANIAASIQKATEEVMLHVVNRAMQRTGLKQVCMSGGVALNSVANGRIERELGCALYVQPAAGDAGSALGAALHHHHIALGAGERRPLFNVYLGKGITDAEIEAAIADAYIDASTRFDSDAALVADVARRLNDGAVIGWVQGRAEWGPRALGARSILANPTKPGMQALMNEKIKFREPFRPFAPSVTVEQADDFFEMTKATTAASPDRFMLSVVRVREEAKKLLPAITHVDGTARVHAVERASNPLYYDLIEGFGRLSGVPVLLNTSFNLRGEPIVNSPTDAIRTFQWSGIDYLVIGRYMLEKEKLVP